MKRIKLGRTELMVSELGLGGIPLTRMEPEAAADLLRHGFAQGISLFDTAAIYGDSEEKIGQGLAGVRQQVVIGSKTLVREGAGALAQLEQSLRRLQTDYLDIYQVHNISSADTLEQVLAPGGAYPALARAKEQGKIRHLGFSAHNLDIAARCCRLDLFDTVQVPFNFVEEDAAQVILPVAGEMDMGVLAMKPLGGGLLARPELCFPYLQQFGRVLPIPGVQARAELDQILDLYRQRRPLDQAARQAMAQIKADLGTRFCHRCEYCMPCPQGVLIPRVLLFPAQVKRFPPQMVKKLAAAPMQSAQECVDCGECEERCPYELPVREMVAEAQDYYREFMAAHGYD